MERGVHGVWNPNQTTDLTVHLTYDVIEDLGDELEEFSRLCQIGSFKDARAFFTNQFEKHMSNPYVYVHYMEMLLEQGNYAAVEELEGSFLLSLHDSLESRLLVIYSGIIVLYTKSRHQSILGNIETKIGQAIQALDPILVNLDDGYEIGSIEVSLCVFKSSYCLTVPIVTSSFASYSRQWPPTSGLTLCC